MVDDKDKIGQNNPQVPDISYDSGTSYIEADTPVPEADKPPLRPLSHPQQSFPLGSHPPHSVVGPSSFRDSLRKPTKPEKLYENLSTQEQELADQAILLVARLVPNMAGGILADMQRIRDTVSGNVGILNGINDIIIAVAQERKVPITLIGASETINNFDPRSTKIIPKSPIQEAEQRFTPGDRDTLRALQNSITAMSQDDKNHNEINVVPNRAVFLSGLRQQREQCLLDLLIGLGVESQKNKGRG